MESMLQEFTRRAAERPTQGETAMDGQRPEFRLELRDIESIIERRQYEAERAGMDRGYANGYRNGEELGAERGKAEALNVVGPRIETLLQSLVPQSEDDEPIDLEKGQQFVTPAVYEAVSKVLYELNELAAGRSFEAAAKGEYADKARPSDHDQHPGMLVLDIPLGSSPLARLFGRGR